MSDIDFDSLNIVLAMDIAELKRLHTGSLLTRLKALRGLQDRFEFSDWTVDEKDAVETAGLIAFKNSELWETAFSDVKAEMSQREHVPRGSKLRRQETTRKKQNR